MYKEIIEKIDVLHAFNKNAFIPLELKNCHGYIPLAHKDVYSQSSLFNYENGAFRFAESSDNTINKTTALSSVKDSLIEAGYLQPEKYQVEWRPVGNINRTYNPELLVQREYWQNFGFEADAVYALVTTIQDNERKIWLQKRAASVVVPNTYDLAVGGALMYPDSLYDTLRKEAKEEAGLNINEYRPTFLGTTNLAYSSGGKATRLAHHLYHINVPASYSPAADNKDEVSGFKLVSVEDSLAMCESGEFASTVVQTFVTCLWQTGMLNGIKGSDAIIKRITPHHRP